MLLAALALGAVAAFAASGPAPCLKGVADDPSTAPATLDDLTACQRRALDDTAARYARKHDGDLPGDDLMKRWQDAQQKETGAFLKAHPDRQSADASDRGTVKTIGIDDGDASTPQASDAAQPPKSADAVDEDALKNKLLGASADGKPVLSQDGAAQINAYLNGKQQGGASGDMAKLLQDLTTTGKPSDDSVKNLRQAAGSTGESAPDFDPSARADEFKKR